MYLLVEMYVWTGSSFFVIYHTVCNWISSQDVNVLLVGPLFPFPWFSGGGVFLGSVVLHTNIKIGRVICGNKMPTSCIR